MLFRSYFRTNRYTDFRTKMGDARLADLIGSLERSVEDTLVAIMQDPSLPLVDRLTIYNRLPEDQRAMCYDGAKARVESDFAASPLAGAGGKVEVLFPEPPNMDAYRARKAAKEREREAEQKARQEGSMDRRR